ncbi:gamma-aminobutyric acid receptor subunit beta-like [Ptychodera flava]|uniref:gamma-aminobutyric acid receptor subunit beta-like n=1 Tax=Ptychodera flava TaxID=63121 RepID=UPI00396A0565
MFLKSSRPLLICLVVSSLAWCPCHVAGQEENNSDSDADEGIANVTKVLNGLLDGYDKRLRPNYGGTPVLVNVSMLVYNLGPIVATSMEYKLDFYFRQLWYDNRLKFSLPDDLYLNADVLNHLWLPDTYFVNEKNAYFHQVTNPNSLVRISPNGRVLYSTRISILASCPMDLKYFPFDQQKCSLVLESYAYTTRDIDYRWVSETPVSLTEGIELPQFSVLGYNSRKYSAIYMVGNYTQLIADFYFVRNLSYYLIQTYFPSVLIVVLSWVSFFVNRNATPARVALGITTVLTMATIMAATNSSLPKISYVKAIDVFLEMCFLYVFASLIEYATVSYFNKARYQEARKQKKLSRESGDIEMNPAAMMEQQGNTRNNLYKAPEHKHTEEPTRCREINEVEMSALDPDDPDDCEVEYHITSTPSNNDPATNGNNNLQGNFVQQIASNFAFPQQSRGVLGRIRYKLKDIKTMGLPASKIDIYSRVLFPMTFVVINVVYWSYYLTVTDFTFEELLARDAQSN